MTKPPQKPVAPGMIVRTGPECRVVRLNTGLARASNAAVRRSIARERTRMCDFFQGHKANTGSGHNGGYKHLNPLILRSVLLAKTPLRREC
jgi:hypothetical protein